MAKNIEQVFTANPITTNLGTDLMYFGRSPYDASDDTAMLYSDFAAQFSGTVTAAEVQASAFNSGIDSGVVNAYVVALTPTLTSAPSTPIYVFLSPGITNTSPTVTLDIGYGPLPLLYNVSNSLVAGDLVAGQQYLILISPSNIGNVINPTQSGGPGTVNPGVENQMAYYATTGDAISGFGPLTNGEIIIGSTGAAPVAATITAGTGINIANAAGSITVTNTAQGLSFVNQTTSTNLVANTLNFVNGGASLVTLTLPTLTTAGDTFTILGYSAGGWQVNKGGATSIQFGTTSSSIGIASSNQFDCITITIVNPTLSVVGIVYGVQGAPTPL